MFLMEEEDKNLDNLRTKDGWVDEILKMFELMLRFDNFDINVLHRLEKAPTSAYKFMKTLC